MAYIDADGYLDCTDPADPGTYPDQDKTMNALIADLLAAKRAEEIAREHRIDCETALIAELGTLKAEGSTTTLIGAAKVTVTTGFNRRLDGIALDSARAVMAPALFDQAVRFKPELNLAGMRSLQTHEPEAYRQLAQAITATPAKPAVKVELVEETQRAA